MHLQSVPINEARDLIEVINDRKPANGLRINAGPKQQILRSFKDDETGLSVVYGKFVQGGSCIANAGKCTIIATFNEGNGHKSASCNEVASLMARYLNKSVWPSPGSRQVISETESAVTWQPYIDAMLIGKGNVADALICSKADCAIWVSTANFTFKIYEAEIPQEDGSDIMETVDEAKNILKLMTGAKPAQGLRINETKYQILRQFDDTLSGCYTVFGKRVRGGVCIVATNRCLIIGAFDENKGHSSAACNEAVADLGKFMLSNKL